MFSKIAVKRPVTTIMLLLMVILAGVVALSGLSMDLMPSVNIPIAIVSTSYTGAGPNEIQTLISRPLEEVLATVSNIDDITTVSSDGSSLIVLQFQDGVDIDMAALDVREKVDLIKSYLPSGADDPFVMKIDPASMTSIYIGVTGNDDLVDLQNILEDRIGNRLERLNGVASVTFMGGLTEEIEVALMPDKLTGYGVNEAQIASVLASENLNLPSGTLVQGDLRLQVRSVGEFKSLNEIENLPVITPAGAVIRLSDLATVKRTTAEPTSYSVINGQRSIIMQIQKQSTANIVNVSRNVKAEMTKIVADYPELKFDTLSDTADYITLSVKNVLKTLLLACLLAVIVLFMFLRNVRASLIIGVSIPTSVIATFGIMYLNNMTLNIISLGGLTIGIGMLVDNSIVVLESIFKKRESGLSSFDAALQGTKEVATAVFASTATTCAVFVPLIFVTGMVGQMFKDLSLTICFSLVSSLVVSMTFVPMACSRMIQYDDRRKKRDKKLLITIILDKWGSLLESIEIKYKKLLGWSLNNKKKVLLIIFVVFIATLSVAPRLGMTFLPDMDQGEIMITVETPSGTLLEETVKISEDVIGRIQDIPEINFAFAYVGSGEMSMMMGSGVDTASIYVMLVDLEERKRSSEEVSAEIRNRIASVAGADITVSASQSAMGSYSSADISLQINGIETEQLKKVGDDFVKLISEIEGTRDVASSAGKAIPEANIVVDRAKAATFGITASSVANAVNTAIRGRVATQYKISGTEIDIRIRYSKDDIEYLNDVENIKIASPRGGGVLLTEVADVTVKDGPVSITRINQQETITVEANVHGRSLNEIHEEVLKKLEGYNMPEGYSYKFTGDIESMMDSFYSLIIVLLVSILLVYMIIASQFESLLNPFIVMFSLPLAMTGGLLALFITGTQVSVSGLMGFIMLAGMVVNNAIVLIDYTSQMRETGLDCNEALLVAAPSRLRPILMTTLTTVIGLAPMAIAAGSGTELTKDLSIVAIGGLILSTLITLIFIPVLYSSFDRIRFRRKRKREAKAKLSAETSLNC